MYLGIYIYIYIYIYIKTQNNKSIERRKGGLKGGVRIKGSQSHYHNYSKDHDLLILVIANFKLLQVGSDALSIIVRERLFRKAISYYLQQSYVGWWDG